jgi:hypothetical protein
MQQDSSFSRLVSTSDIVYMLLCSCCNKYCCEYQVFTNELNLYISEEIEVEVSSCPDNAECIELLSGRQVSEQFIKHLVVL